MLMMLIIVGMFMSVCRGLMSVFVPLVAVGHFLVFMLMHMFFLVRMLMGVMFFVVAVLVGVLRGLVGVLITGVAVGHFLVHVLMFVFVFVFAAHGSSLLFIFQSPALKQALAPALPPASEAR